MLGKTISHFKIIKKLGEGGMSVVYLAEDLKLNRQVAVKFLPHYIAADAKKRKRFETEAKAAASLNHPNIATVYNIEESGDEYFIIMEYIDGQNLREIINTPLNPPLIGGMPIEDIIQIAIQIAEGLQAAHDQGIIHRDIKPENIMIDSSGMVKILDFGLARIHGSTQLTQSGDIMGTAAYISPEQIEGKDVDQRTDIWSFGVMLYEVLTNRLPYSDKRLETVIYSIVNKVPPALSEYRTDIPDPLNKLVVKCMEKEREERYQNFAEIIGDIQKFFPVSAIKRKKMIKTSLKGDLRAVYKNSSRKKRFIKTGLTPFIVSWIMILFLITDSNLPDKESDSLIERSEPESNNPSSPLLNNDDRIIEIRQLKKYDSKGNPIEEIEQMWKASYWENFKKYIFSYDENNIQTLRIEQRWSDNMWINHQKRIYEYNYLDKKLFTTKYQWDGFDWVPTARITEHIDEDGNETGAAKQYWDGSIWVKE